MSEHPNILWITTDQQRWDTLGCLGNPHVRTPHLDRLAGDGALFPLAFCQSPVCTPSRASFLTGRYPRTTRCRQNGQDIPAELAPRRAGDPARLVASSAKAMAQLNWRPRFPKLQTIVEHAWNWHRSHPDGFGG